MQSSVMYVVSRCVSCRNVAYCDMVVMCDKKLFHVLYYIVMLLNVT